MAVTAARGNSARRRAVGAPLAFRALVYSKFVNLHALAADSKESFQSTANMSRGLVPQKLRTIKATAKALDRSPEVVLDAIAETSRALADAMKAKLKAAS